MIEGLIATWVTDTDAFKELELRDPNAADVEPASDEPSDPLSDAGLVLRAILVVGPPDPNALSYLVPRSVFERGHPVHVGALAIDEALPDGGLLEAVLDILEVMNPHDIVVFLCDTAQTLNAAVDLMAPESPDPHAP
jgi:hypothetical protein